MVLTRTAAAFARIFGLFFGLMLINFPDPLSMAWGAMGVLLLAWSYWSSKQHKKEQQLYNELLAYCRQCEQKGKKNYDN